MHFYCKSTINNNTMAYFQEPFLPSSHSETFLKCLKLIQNLSSHSVLYWVLDPLLQDFPPKGWQGSHIIYLIHLHKDTASQFGEPVTILDPEREVAGLSESENESRAPDSQSGQTQPPTTLGALQCQKPQTLSTQTPKLNLIIGPNGSWEEPDL